MKPQLQSMKKKICSGEMPKNKVITSGVKDKLKGNKL